MFYLLALFYFFYFAIVGIYIIFMPKVLAMVAYSPSEIGIIFGAAPLVRFLLPFVFSRGRKLDARVFNLAILVMFISSISFYFSLHSFYALFISNIGLGIGMSLILPYIEILALEVVGKERYGKVRLYGSVGFVLVALILVRYLSSPDVALSYLLILASITSLVAFIIVKIVGKTQEMKQDSKNDVKLLKHWKLWLSLMLMQVSFGAYYNFFTIYETAYGVTLDMTINLWVFGVIVEIFMLFYQGKLLKLNLLYILEITTLSAVVRWMLLYLFPQNLVVLFFAQSLHALSFALFYSAAISYLHQLYSSKVLAQQFFSGITFGLGGFVGAIIFGYIYEYFSSYIFLVASLVAFASFIFIHLWRRGVTSKKTSFFY